MAELTLSVILQMVQTAALLIGIFYYLTTLRNQKQTRKHSEETRRIQVASHIAQRPQSKELSTIALELYDMTWTDFDDFFSKYDSTVNPENYAKRTRIFAIYEEAGYMLSKGMFDLETLYELGNPSGNLVLWEKFKPIIMGYRERYNDPNRNRWWEYLTKEYKKERVRRGMPSDITDADRVIHQRYTDHD